MRATPDGWRAAMRARGHWHDFGDHALLYQVSIDPAVPPEWKVDGMAALTFRLAEDDEGRLLLATSLALPVVLRIGARFGLDEAESVAFVDSHERMHVHLQLDGVSEEREEEASRFVDAVWLALRHPRAAAMLEAGPFGLVTRVGPAFWEELLLEDQASFQNL
ncbi:MAG TPA: hypothetical protein VM889_08245 [Candidatus Thermoplasmatota archaeon]|nr:hypothetical protein [Candidatus Thermoplasmatota archaeon]